VELELDNFRAALAWALTQNNDAVLGGAIAGALSELWYNAGLPVEGRYWIGLALEGISEVEQPRIVGGLWSALNILSSGQRKHDSAKSAVRLFASVDDARGVARAQGRLAFALYQMGQLDEAKAMIEQALPALRACRDASNVARCLNTQATIAISGGKFGAARELFAQALAAYKALGDESGIANILGNTAELEFADGHPEQALSAAIEALEIRLRGKNATEIAILHNNIAAYRIALGDLAGAPDSAREGLRVARQARNEQSITVALQHLAALAGLGGDARRGAQLLGYVDAQYGVLGMQREPTEQWATTSSWLRCARR
jgi:tetratricopeptide (TPR) repeat protein